MIAPRFIVALLVAIAVSSLPDARSQTEGAASPARVSYQLTEGQNLNAFLRDGNVAAHLLLRSGRDPRILVAFPAGNSGVGLWFDHLDCDVSWRLDRAPEPVTIEDAAGRPLYGIVVRATVTAPRLSVKQAVLSNVRFLRDYQAVGAFPPEVAVTMRRRGQTLSFRRDRLDGAPGYQLAGSV